jgi:hypothetical protein
MGMPAFSAAGHKGAQSAISRDRRSEIFPVIAESLPVALFKIKSLLNR